MALHPIWGLYLPYFRLNVDQVPIPFINGAEATYDEVGATHGSADQRPPIWSEQATVTYRLSRVAVLTTIPRELTM